MIESYDIRENRILMILESNNKVHKEILEKKLEIGSKTLSNDVNFLNKIFDRIAYIRFESNYYSLIIRDIERYNIKKKELFNKSDNFSNVKSRLANIFISLANNGIMTMDELSENVFVSKKTLSSDILKLKSILAEYGLMLKSKTNKGVWLEGNEWDIRLFIADNIFDMIREKSKISDLDLEYIKDLAIKKSLLGFVSSEFVKYLIIVVYRNARGYKINSRRVKEYFPSSYIMLLEEISKYIKNRYDILLDDGEIHYLLSVSVIYNTALNRSILDEDVIDNSCNDLIAKMIEDIYRSYGLNIDKKYINKEFKHHIYFMIKRLSIGFRYKNDIVDKIKEKYNLAYKISEIAAKSVSSIYGCSLSQDEIAFMAIYFEMILGNIKKETSINVLIITDYSEAYRCFIAQEIRSKLSDTVSIEFSINTEDCDNKKYDIIISTLDENINTNATVIRQKDLTDSSYICNQIENYKLFKDNNPTIRGLNGIIPNIISKENFYIPSLEDTFQDICINVIDDMEKRGLVDKEFCKGILDKVKGKSFLFSEYLAIPHAINKELSEIQISIVSIDKGLKDYPNLKMIVVLAIPEDMDNNILIKVYNELTELSNNIKLLYDLSSCTDYESWISILMSKFNI